MIDNNLSEEDIIEIYDNNWHDISYHQYLTEDFIRKYKSKIYWGDISINQKLSENFIREFQDKVIFTFFLKPSNIEIYK